MADWIPTLIVILLLLAGLVFANRKMGSVRKDGRPNQVPWGFVMVTCAFGLFIAVVHVINLAGFETGPEHGLLGRFGG